MGTREERLRSLLATGCSRRIQNRIPVPRYEDYLNSDLFEEVDNVYRKLGGIMDTPPVKPGIWDVECGNVAVELDEELHFNRYRVLTLSSTLYSDLPHFPLMQYQQYCRDFEDECIRAGGYGGKWTNPSCARQFGMAAPHKCFSGAGAPRWKQRAFYDFIKDLSPFLTGVRVARVSIWDTVKVRENSWVLKEALDSDSKEVAEAVLRLVRSRC